MSGKRISPRIKSVENIIVKSAAIVEALAILEKSRLCIILFSIFEVLLLMFPYFLVSEL